jgi:DNA-binding NtrC family response regulator
MSIRQRTSFGRYQIVLQRRINFGTKSHREGVICSLQIAIAASRCEARTRTVEGRMPTKLTELNLLGDSPAFHVLLAQIARFAQCDATVLIDGETGTGKELAARAIHYLSPRGEGPFIPINCGAIPDALIGSELFGYSRGAFTDAREARQGLIAQAEGGTLFLDELETLSFAGQVALLRFLQDHEYRPLGASQTRLANVRVIGATNAKLADLAQRGSFRQDLLYRLNVLTLDVPPLRARGDDAVVLARAFLKTLCARYLQPERGLHPDAVHALRQHSWPGNVRELENLIHREFLLADDVQLALAALPRAAGADTERRVASRRCVDTPASQVSSQPVMHHTEFREAKAQAIADFEREYVCRLLEKAGGNVSLAARLAGKERSRFNRLVRKYRISAREYRGDGSFHPAS